MRRRNGSIAADVVKEALAGAAATSVTGRATTWVYEHEGERCATERIGPVAARPLTE